jgi:lysine-specific demethylase 8
MTQSTLPGVVPLPVAVRPTPRAFESDFRRPGIAVRLRGAANDWAALGRWSPDDLRARFGDTLVSAYAMRGGEILLDPVRGFRIERVPLRTYVDATLAGGPPSLYLRAPLPDVIPELAREIKTPVYCEGGLLLRRNLWFSAQGTITALHFDLPDNLIVQVHGRKRFVLFPPSERRHLYPHAWRSTTPHLARLDPERPDFVRHPRARDARGFTCTLEPGDALFLPSRWWHHASSIETSISVNHWWSSPLLYPFVRASDLYKRVRGLDI